MRTPLALVLALAAVCMSCSRGRAYPLTGQILAVDAKRGEVTVRHEDIRGFMPGMTMTFKVRDADALEDRAPGELIRATLVVEGSAAFLEDIERRGVAPIEDASVPVRVPLLDLGEPVPDARLVDERGLARRVSDFRGRALAVTFTYTRCPLPDFCPLVDRRFAEVQRAAAADGRLSDRVHLLSVSFDPEFDTPAVLTAHARRAGAEPARWSFMTGDRDEVQAFAARFGVSIMRDGPSAANVVHNLRTAVVDPAGRLVNVFNGSDWQVDDLVAALRTAVDGR